MTHHNTIAIIFDFDDTLAPDSTSDFLESLGADAREYWKEVPAYLNRMIELSGERAASQRLTQKKLRQFGKKLKFHKGVAIDKLARGVALWSMTYQG